MAKRKSDEELLQMYEEKEKKILARKKELQQRINERRDKTRTHLMCVYGGKVEEAYKKLYNDNDKRLFVEENINILNLIYDAIINNLPNLKDEMKKIKKLEQQLDKELEKKEKEEKESQTNSDPQKVETPQKVENAEKTDKKEMPTTQTATNTTLAPTCKKCGAKLIMLTYKSKNKDNGRKYWSCPNNTEDDPHPAFWVEN